MTEQESHEKKQFTIPNKDELIDLIKNLDQDIQHISLNLIKCDFNATEKDVEKAFPDFNFIKVKNYNPGSFEVVLQMRIDAINFIRNCYDKKILSRRFFIKMGRQHKELIEDWTGVGYAPRQFRPNKNYNKDHAHKDYPNKEHQSKDLQNKEQKQHKEYKKHEHKKPEEKKQQTNEGQKKTQQTKSHVQQLVKQEKVAAQKTQQVKKGKEIPKNDFHKKKNNTYNKPRAEQGQLDNKTQKVQLQVKQDKPVQKIQQKKIQKNVANTKPVQQKQQKDKVKNVEQVRKPAEKIVEKVKVQEKEQDDGWIVIPPKSNTKQKKR